MTEDTAFNLAGFDRYLEEHGIPEEHHPAAFALWIAQNMGGFRGSRKPAWALPQDTLGLPCRTPRATSSGGRPLLAIWPAGAPAA
jgi:hypothetical protein